MERKWTPLHPHNVFEFNVGKYALSILNQEITIPPAKMTLLWNKADVRTIVDGGTDKWFNYVREKRLKVRNKFPEIVSGDFDTITPTSLKLCRHNGVHIEKTPDECFTDFHKSLQVLGEVYKRRLDSILVVCNNTGRLDHIYGNLNTLTTLNFFFHQDAPPASFLVAGDCLTWLIPKGYHRIYIPRYLIDSGEWCSILPFEPKPNSVSTNGLKFDLNVPPEAFLVGDRSITWHLTRGFHKISIPKYLIEAGEWCSVLPFEPKKGSITSTGLKYELRNHSINFGGLVSSSNSYNGNPYVTIATDAELIWSMGINSPPKTIRK